MSGGEPTLFGPAPRRRRVAGPPVGAGSTGPVAQVAVDVPLPHLDHLFSYAVPAPLAGGVVAGSRVTVPFAGRAEDGWVLAVGDGPLDGLRPLRRLVTPLAPLTDEVSGLARAVADATAGTIVDVLRAAVPPRHAGAEKALLATDGSRTTPTSTASASTAPTSTPPVGAPAAVDPGGWASCVGGEAFLRRTADGEGPRAAVRLPLDVDPWAAVLVAARAALASDRDVVVVLPDVADVEACAAVLAAGLDGPGTVAPLHHGLGPSARWREFLRLRTGRARVAVGTRSAVFAPVARPGLVLVWDDGDDGHVEPHAPGWDSGLAGLLRAERSGAALALLSRARSVRTQQWVRTGRVKDIAPGRGRRRAGAPLVVVPDPADPLEAHARVPRQAHRVAAEGLRAGPVLVSVPRGGYATALQCGRCRHGARCPRCSGPLAVPAAGPAGAVGAVGAVGPAGAAGAVGAAGPAGPAGAPLVCRWCARTATAWSCPECGGRSVRAGVVGVVRSAEEWGRSFPGTPVVLSRGGHRAAPVGSSPRVVVATPGTEPAAAGGYAAALVLDGDLALSRRGLAVEEETLRRWLAVAALVRPAPDGGRVAVVADPRHRVVQALVQDAPELLAGRLLDERAEAGLPPARTVARLLGAEQDLADVAATLRHEGTLLAPSPAGAGGGADEAPLLVLGPAPTDDGEAWQLLVSGTAEAVRRTARDLLAARSAAKAPGRLVLRLDPHDLD